MCVMKVKILFSPILLKRGLISSRSMCWDCLLKVSAGYCWGWITIECTSCPHDWELIQKNNLGVGDVSKPTVGETSLTFLGGSGWDGTKRCKEIRYLEIRSYRLLTGVSSCFFVGFNYKRINTMVIKIH